MPQFTITTSASGLCSGPVRACQPKGEPLYNKNLVSHCHHLSPSRTIYLLNFPDIRELLSNQSLLFQPSNQVQLFVSTITTLPTTTTSLLFYKSLKSIKLVSTITTTPTITTFPTITTSLHLGVGVKMRW